MPPNLAYELHWFRIVESSDRAVVSLSLFELCEWEGSDRFSAYLS